MVLRNQCKQFFMIGFMALSVASFVFILIVNDIVSNQDMWMHYIGIIISTHMLFSMIAVSKHGYKFYSPANLFLICMFVFYWGHFVLLAFFKDYRFRASGGNMITRYPEAVYRNSCLYIIAFISFYVVGLIINNYIKPSKYAALHEEHLSYLKNKQTIKKIAYLVLIITLPFNAYTTLKYISISMMGGYIATFNSGMSDTVTTLGEIAVVGFVLLMYAIPKKSWLIFIAASGYYAISLFSGNRSPAICAILTMWCFYKYVGHSDKKIKMLYVILIVLVGYFGLSALGTLQHFRDHSSNKSIPLFIELYANDLRNNAFLRAVEEFGSTVADVSIIQMYLADTGKYLLGWSFVASLFSIFPNIGGFIAPLTKSGNFGRIVITHGIYGGYTAIGGSCIAESIINFGIVFWIEAFIVGIIMGELSTRIDRAKDYKIAYYIIPVYVSMFWVRGYFGDMVRIVVWSWIILYVIKALLPIERWNSFNR